MDERIINNIKSLAIDMIKNANSGHPGIVLGAAPILYTLYKNHINASTSDANWIGRDRFVMSAGHGSALLYATLYMAGYAISLEDLKNFRKLGSNTPGHPEVHVTPGVDVSTGPLGQGIATAVGLALAEKMLEEKTKVNGKPLISNKVYVLAGDGDLMEGISYEALSFAGVNNLNNLIILYDSNHVTLDGPTTSVFEENIKARMESIGFNYLHVKDGNIIRDIDKAITKAKVSKRPTLIEVNTIIGRGSYLEGTNEVHGKPLTDDDIKQLKLNLQMPDTLFHVDEEARNTFRKTFQERSATSYQRFASVYNEAIKDAELLKQINFIFGKKITFDFLNYDFKIEPKKEATRVTNRKVMNEIAKYVPFLVGGSADLSSTTNTYLDNLGDISKDNFKARNIHFGIREHAQGAIANGLALCNYRPFVSTFLCFSDYLKPAIRMSSIMELPVTYIFSHDSIYVGQDGPTHQPIEQLAMLRSIPNLNVYRPCDLNELIGAWNSILNDSKTPSALILSRTDLDLVETTDKKGVEKGAYIIRKENKLDGILIATGSEVSFALTLANVIHKEENIDLRVVSMPCQEKFEKQDIKYKEEILPECNHIFTIEAATTFGWEKYATKGHTIGIDTFGASGSLEEVREKLGFDFKSVKEKIIKEIK